MDCPEPQPTPSCEQLLWMYQRMSLIREFEERLKHLVETGVPVGAVHYYVGQEAVAVGVCAVLERTDYIASTHRGHGHCIAKGVDVRPMMAEVYGKATGTNKGKGGSMHITDVRVGMLGVNPIVGWVQPTLLAQRSRPKCGKAAKSRQRFLVMAPPALAPSTRR